MTATLRMYVTTTVAGRTLQAWRAGAAWTEGAVTWNIAPGTAGATLATVASPAAPGWVELPVTALVTDLYAGANNGFLLKDASEGGGANLGQSFSSRTGANPPQLVLTFGATAARPAAPSSLSATAVSGARVNLAWSDNSATETGSVVERSTSPTTGWAEVATVGADVTTFGDNGLTPSTTYYYRVRATNALGSSAASNVASATTLEPPAAPPVAPTGLAAASVGVNTISLTWTDNATTEDGFVIERSPAGAGTWTQAGTVGPDITAFESTALTAATAYDHRVRAVNSTGASDWSNPVTASTAACGTVPTQTLTATADALVMQIYPTLAIGELSPASLLTRSANAANGRALVRFDNPTVPLGCVVATATLRLNVTAQTSARTVQVLRAGGAWQENTVTWNSQPVTAGPASSVPSAVGWLSVPVTDQVLAQLSDLNHGFVIRDSVEDAGVTADVTMTSKEAGAPSQLLVTLGP